MKHSGSVRFIILLAAAMTALFSIGAAAVLNRQPLREQGTSVPKSPASVASSKKGTSSGTQKAPESKKPLNVLICGIDNTSSLTDVIMLASFDERQKKIAVLQIPRDTYAGAGIPTNKYNAVYGSHKKGVSGMETLRAKAESDFGIRIDRYAAITTKGLRTLVDAAGGVEFNVPINMNYDDPKQNLHIHLKKGMQHLNGSQAEQFVRYRKGWTQGDIGRLDAQKIFLAAFSKKLKSMGIWGITAKLLPVIKTPDFLTDMNTYEMIKYGSAMSKVPLSSAKVYTMPGESYISGGASFYSVHKKALLDIINSDFVPKGTNLSFSDLGIAQMSYEAENSGAYGSFSGIINKNTK